jgi:UDP-N-acetylmuramoylalanine--D-glutamate ligase
MKLELKNKRVLVLGLGETGLSALRWLEKQGAILSVADSRDNPPNIDPLIKAMPNLSIYKGKFQQEVLLSAEVIVISPGVPLSDPAVKVAIAHGIPVIGDVELFAQYRLKNTKVIGITGSNGKTTVTSLVGEICKQAGLKTIVAGNIGLPVLDVLQMDVPDIYVLELSSFQLETTNSLILDAATILNVTEDHMDRYDTFKDYAKAKSRILTHAKVTILNRDDLTTLAMSLESAAPKGTFTFGLNEAPTQNDFGIINTDESQFLVHGKRKLCKTNELKISGQHNVANALAASALCHAVGIENESIVAALRKFNGLPHRVEWVANIENVDYVDDSKGTNVGATCAAINGMTKNNRPQKVVLIAGGDGKGQDFSPLASAVENNCRAIVLYGRDAHMIETVLLSTNVSIYQAHDLKEAVNIAKKIAVSGDAVLLSPACASFDMFKNYVHRAEVFIEAVKQLENENIKAGDMLRSSIC